MSLRNMAKESNSETEDNNNADGRARKEESKGRLTRSRARRNSPSYSPKSSVSEQEKPSDSQHNSPILRSASVKRDQDEVGGIQRIKRIKKKTNKMLESEIYLKNSYSEGE